MDQDRPRRRRRRRRHRGRSRDDYISALPDELLHSILLRLGSVRAAARTGVLSRRWRPVWRHLPELVFGNGGHEGAPPPSASTFPDAVFGVDSRRWRPVWRDMSELVFHNGGRHDAHGAPPPPASTLFPDTVDGALSGYAAPTLGGLVIILPSTPAGLNVPARRIAPWFRFAAERVAGELILFMPRPPPPPTIRELDSLLHREPEIVDGEEGVLELPACERAKTITLRLKHDWLQRPDWRLRLRPAGSFAVLTTLRILFARIEGSELTALVCTRCPCLRDLRLALELVDACDVSIRSESLRTLSLNVKKILRLEIVTPRLEYLYVYATDEARISAPMLAGLVWCFGAYDPDRHQLEDVGRHLRLLEINLISTAAMLVQRFDEVEELKLGIDISKEIAAYKSFLNQTNKVPKCETLSITFAWNNHGLTPVMLHLLRSCSSTKKVSIQLLHICGYSSSYYPCHSSCPCRLEESCSTDDIVLNSLEEVEIICTKSSQEEYLLEIVEQLLRCNAPMLKNLALSVCSAPSETKVVCEKIRNLCHPNIEVEF